MVARKVNKLDIELEDGTVLCIDLDKPAVMTSRRSFRQKRGLSWDETTGFTEWNIRWSIADPVGEDK